MPQPLELPTKQEASAKQEASGSDWGIGVALQNTDSDEDEAQRPFRCTPNPTQLDSVAFAHRVL